MTTDGTTTAGATVGQLYEHPPAGQTWRREPRFPEPPLPLLAATWLPIHARTIGRSFERLGVPLATIESRVIDGHVYTRPVTVPPSARDRRPPPAPVMRVVSRLVPPLRRRLRVAAEAHRTGRVATMIDEWVIARTRLQTERDALLTASRGSMSDVELADHVDAIVTQLEAAGAAHFDASLAGVFVATGQLGMLVEELLGWDVAQVVTLVQGYGDASTAHSSALAALADELGADGLAAAERDPAAFVRLPAVESYLRRFGHRVVDDLRAPTEHEDPSRLIRRLRDVLAAPAARADPRAAARAAEAEARERIVEAERARFDDALELARRGRPIGDESEGLVFDMFALLRYAALEAGGRLTAGGHLTEIDDVWFLQADEIADALRGAPADTGEVARRRRNHRLASERGAPDVIGPDLDGVLPVDAVPRAARPVVGAVLWTLATEQQIVAPDQDPSAMRGHAGSPGVATGTARVVRSTAEFDRIEPGDILVCPTTVGAWSPVFGLIAGIVTEHGGALSHPAILAREHGIPAVLGVADATSRIADGDPISIDGTTGAVGLTTRLTEGTAT